MTLAGDISAPIRHADRFFIGGQWATPSSGATINVIDPGTETVFFSVAEARADDIDRAVSAAREAFDGGPWPRRPHARRAEYLRALGEEVSRRSADIAQLWRRIASICGERIARCTLELGGKSAAVVLDDADLETAAQALAQAECLLSGQVCASLTRIVVSRPRHDEMVEALAAAFSKVKVGDPFDPASQMGPLAVERQRTRVEGYIAKGVEGGAILATSGGRPKDLERGWYVEPTVFGNVDNASVIAQEEIFGPVLSVIPAADEADAVRIANETIYGLHGAVFTNDVERAREVAGQMRTGAIGHNGFKSDFDMGHGGFKQSGIGREGGIDGLLPFLQSKAILLDGPTARYQGTGL
jgi:aldehyde dehydrogenase (NAD+)